MENVENALKVMAEAVTVLAQEIRKEQKNNLVLFMETLNVLMERKYGNNGITTFEENTNPVEMAEMYFEFIEEMIMGAQEIMHESTMAHIMHKMEQIDYNDIDLPGDKKRRQR